MIWLMVIPPIMGILLVDIYIYMVGGFNPSEKYESQLGLLFQIYGENMFQKNTHIYIYTPLLGSY
jgi:hypothetical protein